MPRIPKDLLERNPWSTIILAVVFTLIVGLFALALHINPELNPERGAAVTETDLETTQ